MLAGANHTILEQLHNNVAVEVIQQSLQLDISLLHFAMLNDLDDVRDALLARNIDLNKANALGETIVHHAAQMGNMAAVLKVVEWANRGLVNFSARTAIHSNFFHFVSSIDDETCIETLLNMATPELLTQSNRLGDSPLRRMIQVDNAIFLQAVLRRFPQLVSLEQDEDCLKMHCETLLHDIATFGAEKCFKVVRAFFSEYEWNELNRFRNTDGSLPVDSAKDSHQHRMFEMFKNYRSKGALPTLEWISAMQVAKANISLINITNQEIVDDAKDMVQQQKLDEEPFADADMSDEFENSVGACYRIHSR